MGKIDMKESWCLMDYHVSAQTCKNPRHFKISQGCGGNHEQSKKLIQVSNNETLNSDFNARQTWNVRGSAGCSRSYWSSSYWVNCICWLYRSWNYVKYNQITAQRLTPISDIEDAHNLTPELEQSSHIIVQRKKITDLRSHLPIMENFFTETLPECREKDLPTIVLSSMGRIQLKTEPKRGICRMMPFS